MATVHFGPRYARPLFCMPMNAEWLGWASSAVLLATLLRQVYSQWRQRSVEGVSSWLFIGQLTASTGFLVYSLLVDNWVFVFTNAALLVTALVGQVIYRHNVRRGQN
jgi:MtN3 and saliva related transmembrane protein